MSVPLENELMNLCSITSFGFPFLGNNSVFRDYSDFSPC